MVIKTFPLKRFYVMMELGERMDIEKDNMDDKINHAIIQADSNLKVEKMGLSKEQLILLKEAFEAKKGVNSFLFELVELTKKGEIPRIEDLTKKRK